ncbi:hypothetical protein Tco_1460052 [Tanacetum coccineum]
MLDDSYVHAALQAPPTPDCILGPEEPQSPPLSDFVPEPSPNYVSEFDPEADPEEDDDEDLEEDSVDYPTDGGDDGNDEDDSSEDDEDDDVDIEADDDDEEEEHPAPADSTSIALPAADQAPSAKETDPFETDESTTTPPPHPAYRVTTRISIPAQVPTPVWSDEEVARLLAISTPPSLTLSPWSSPLPQIPSPPLPQIPSPPLPVSSPVPMISPSPPASPIRPLGYRAAMIRLRAEASSTSYSLPLPPPIILSYTRSDAPSSGIPQFYPYRYLLHHHLCIYSLLTVEQTDPRPPGGIKVDYGFVTAMDGEIMRDLERDVGYGIIDTRDEILVDMSGAPATDDTELGQRMTEFTTRFRQDTDEIYTRLDDEQTERQLMAGRPNMLYRDRRAHVRTAKLMEAEARMSREAWGRSMDATDLAHAEVMSLRTQVVVQQAVITEL